MRRISKPSPDPIYPAYVVGDSDNVVGKIRVAALTKPKSTLDQVEDLLRRLLAGMVPEVPMVEKLLQRLVAETQSRQPAPVSPPEPMGLGNLLRLYLSGQQTSGQQTSGEQTSGQHTSGQQTSGQQTSGQQTRQRPIRQDWNGIICFSCGKSCHSATRCPALDESIPFMLPGWRAETTPGGFIMISPCVAAERHQTATDPGEGFATRISSSIRPQDPGGGGLTIATPRGVMDIEVTNSPELSVGGASVCSLTDFGGVGRGGQDWGHSTFGVSTCGSGYTVIGWNGEAGQCDRL